TKKLCTHLSRPPSVMPWHNLVAAGVHLRSDSLPVGVARKLLGAARIIGVSTHSVDEAVRAEAEGADFVVVGPIYDTPSKREYGAPLGVQSLEEAARRCRIPVLAIGGITPARLPEVKRAGASGAAVVSSILSASSIEAATKQFIALWASL
ncbi:MAG: thiamine phosphate synthase, partial [Nitrospira sp.]